MNPQTERIADAEVFKTRNFPNVCMYIKVAGEWLNNVGGGCKSYRCCFFVFVFVAATIKWLLSWLQIILRDKSHCFKLALQQFSIYCYKTKYVFYGVYEVGGWMDGGGLVGGRQHSDTIRPAKGRKVCVINKQL